MTPTEANPPRAATELRETLKLAVPIAFSQLALMTMGLVDAAMVGRVSAADLAAVAMSNSLFFAVVCPAMGVTMAVEPLASQAVGAGDEARAWESFRAGVVACLLLSLPTMAMVGLSTLSLGGFGIEASLVGPVRAVMLVRLWGVPGWLLFMAAKAYLEARGVTRPLYVGGWAANAVNFVVCGVLVFGDRALVWAGLPGVGLPSLGSLGAGFAMLVGNLFLAAWSLAWAYRVRPQGAPLLGWGPELRVQSLKLIRVGMPIGFLLLTEVGVFSLAGLLVGRLGSVATAAHQVAMGMASFTYMGVLGLSGATAVRVGRAIGAGEEGGPRRAGSVGVALGALYMAFCGLVFVAAPRPIAGLFSEDTAVVEVAVTLLRVAAAFQIFDGVQGVAAGALRGAADTRFASWVNVVCHWCIGLPLVLLFGLALGRGVEGFWWGLSVGLMVAAAAMLWRFWSVSSKTIAAV